MAKKLSVKEQKSELAQTGGKVVSIKKLKLTDVISEEEFQSALKGIEKNIEDKRTDPDKNRFINIKVCFEPGEKRQGAAVTSIIDSKLAPLVGGAASFAQFGTDVLPLK